ncbi:hypothetical protein F5878DRAFT_24466 [Lentinula raphanica]|uniref:Uncharacterized protein n=1 Tax=Lentinula raphanica TaxID=153919 RepID=A0AA38NX01_9AGAR|nr:hypothetical protein F5878DRAFT_24466 [Lentinula raphanica]
MLYIDEAVAVATSVVLHTTEVSCQSIVAGFLLTSSVAYFLTVEKLLLFLVESGSAFCLFQLLFAIFETLNLYQTTTTDSSIQVTTLILYSIFNGFAVLYPLAVIIMVSLNNSVIEESLHSQHFTSTGHSEDTSDSPPIRMDATKVSTMHFALGTRTSAVTTDASTL